MKSYAYKLTPFEIFSKEGRRTVFVLPSKTGVPFKRYPRRINRMDKKLVLDYLAYRRSPLLRNDSASDLHAALCEVAPDFYARLLADAVTDVSHKRTMLVNLLSNPAAKDIEHVRILDALYVLPPPEALHIVSVIRHRRINRSRARQIVLNFLLGHEQLSFLAASRKKRVVQLLKHALGEQTWSSVKRFLAETTTEGEHFLEREVLRYAKHDATAHVREVLCFLADAPFKPTDPLLTTSLAARKDLTRGTGLPRETLLGLRGIYHQQFPVRRIPQLAAAEGEKNRVDGPLTVLYKEALKNALVEVPVKPLPEQSPDLENAVEKSSQSAQQTLLMTVQKALAQLLKISGANAGQTKMQSVSPGEQTTMKADQRLTGTMAQAIASLPPVTGRLAIVLDLSASMSASGERAYHPAALALALTRLLQERVQDVMLYQVGGSRVFGGENVPLPQEATDIATALLDAARQQPEVILVFTDGYENIRQGDAELVVQGMRHLGLTLPVYQVVPLFTAAENLAQRQLGPAIPVIPLTHESGVQELLAHLLLASADTTLSSEEMDQLQVILFGR